VRDTGIELVPGANFHWCPYLHQRAIYLQIRETVPAELPGSNVG
jgi:hypothetical protein